MTSRVELLSNIQAGGDIVISMGDVKITQRRPDIPPFQLKRNPNRYFVGREKALNQLEKQLIEDSKVAISAVVGMGGIGKTELALQYATDANKKGKYPGGICWIDVRGKDVADEILDFANGYLNFVPPDNLSLDKKVEICWNLWFQAFPETKLVIFDDVVAYEQIKDFLPPQIASLQVIITTRLRLDALNIASLTLKVLEEEDSLLLLASYIGSERLTSELDDAKALCQWVGNLPLGLTLVGRYLREFPEDSLAKLLERLQETGLDQAAMHEVGIPIGNGKTTADLREGERYLYEGVYAVFNLNWESLRQPGKQLGAILSLFNAPAYTWSLVEKVAPPLAGQRGVAKISLKDLHLIHEDEDNPIHSLIQEFFLKKMKEDKHFLGVWDILFNNFIFQQFIYDTGYLENGLERIEKIRDCLPEDATKGQIILSKMIGHSYYADRDTGTTPAVKNFLNTRAYSQSQTLDNVERWYQIFAIDHAHNLVVPKGSIDINGESYSAQSLELMLDELLPDTLKQLSTPPGAEVAPYILRAGHYWGHRGNQCAFLLFRDIQALSPQRFDSLYNRGIEYYARAAVFRLTNFRLSNPRDYEKELKSDLVNAPYIPSWLTDWDDSTFQGYDTTFERFTSAAQAIGDTAHQYRGVADIKLWGYLYREKHEKQVDTSFIQEASKLVNVTEDLWKAAQNLLKKNEKIIKYYLWMANLETKFELIDAHHNGHDLISWEEAESRLIDDLDELEEKYRLGYEWARRVSMKQLRKFYDTLAELYG